MLRENFRNVKLKSILLPALGEILFLAARLQEQTTAAVTGSQQSITTLTFTMVLKCLKEGVSSFHAHVQVIKHCHASIHLDYIINS